MTNLQLLAQFAEAMGTVKKEVLAADKCFETYDEFINSTELKEIHAGFQSKTTITVDMFKRAWVIGKDVYVSYKADGINFIKKESICSVLSNGALLNVIPLKEGLIIIKDTRYAKCEENRKIFRKSDWMNLIAE